MFYINVFCSFCLAALYWFIFHALKWSFEETTISDLSICEPVCSFICLSLERVELLVQSVDGKRMHDVTSLSGPVLMLTLLLCLWGGGQPSSTTVHSLDQCRPGTPHLRPQILTLVHLPASNMSALPWWRCYYYQSVVTVFYQIKVHE